MTTIGEREKWIYSGGFVAIATVMSIALIYPELLQQLFSANGFIPHGHCYLWKPSLVWLHLLSDALIAGAYVAISATLAYLVYRTRREIPFHWMFLAFGSFIVACGITHFMAILTLWHPIYWLSGLLKAVTATASVATALVLPSLVPKALALVESARLSEERRTHLEAANHTLETLYSKLKAVDQLKTQFFANVSHELRTPLALILGPTEQLLTHAQLSQEQQHSLQVIDRNARLLLKQVNDLLDVSKLEAGKMEVQYVNTDLAELVLLTAANFDGLAEERKIAFTVETPDQLLTQVDIAKVQRILLNLLSNAFKFTPGAGKIRCAVATDSEIDPSNVVITVCDSGSGVPLHLREVIFDRFQQIEGGSTRRFGGTGLGLAIVKEFVELLAGSIAVGDAPEGGACFTVKLPLMKPSELGIEPGDQTVSLIEDTSRSIVEELRTRSQTLSVPVGPEAGKPVVLVVEDNSEMNQFISETLASEYCTATAKDGREGLEKALALSPDLILTDVMMPHLSGDQLVQQLRSHPQFDATPIVVLTAKADDDLQVRLLKQGAQDYLMKPFSVEELQARVGNLVAIKRTREVLQHELASQSYDLEAMAQEISLSRRELQLALEAMQRQAEELAEANRLKDEFLAIVSHELRTPLNSILGWSKLLRSRTFDEATTARALETIERNAELQTRLIENLLDISRLLRGKLLLNLRPTQVQSVIETAIQTVQVEAEAKGIHLEAQLDTSISPISGDFMRLQQVFQNLLANAIKFTPSGGHVVVKLERQGDTVVIQVQDSGEGIKPEALPFVFDYFWQADSSISRKHSGLGLGLAIVRQLVELHDGQIEAKSAGTGQGAIFTVTLPLMLDPAIPRYLS